MFRTTRDPSSGCFTQCLAKITVMVLSCVLKLVGAILNILKYFIIIPVCIYELYICTSVG